MTKICPNHEGCRLVNTDVVVPDSEKKKNYISSYCMKKRKWETCKRFIVRRALWISPDFVLPDTTLTEDEIIDLYESQESQK